MPLPRITAAVGDFDRTRPLLDGRVAVEGFDVAWTSGELESIFSRAFETAEFDVTELSFSNFVIATQKGGSPYAGLPIFPTRCFRQHAIYMRTDRGMAVPRDLEGRRVGLREYTNTASVAARGALQTFYGVDLAKVHWVVGDVNKRERTKFPVPSLPAPYRIEAEPDALLSDMLADGRIDGLISYSPPNCIREAGVGRLFPRWWEEERRYYQATGVFPIMHLMVVRRDTAQRYPELIPALFKAFSKAKCLAIAELEIEQAPKIMLPWTPAHLVEARELMGDDFWPYGVAPNRKTLEAQLAFSREQHLVPRSVAVEELFHESALTLAER